MNPITKETRLESYITRPATRADKILERLRDNQMTAREIAYSMGFSELNSVRPRISELLKAGEIEVVGKTKDMVTGKSVAVFAIKEKTAEQQSFQN